jgi:hypothetical protein
MKRNTSSIFWGLLFILGGAALLADRMGWINFRLLSTNTWVYVFAALSLVFFLGYFFNGLRQWGWLFPALIFAAISLTIWMTEHGLTRSYVGMPILLSIAIPFYVGFAFNRRAWGLLIPAWVLTVLALITLSADLVDGNLIGALFLFAVALPFLLVYLTNRTRRWALIPAAATALVGAIALLASVSGGDWPGAAFMLLFSAAFFFVFFRRKEYWWALIPSGVFASIGLVIILGILLPHNLPIFDALLNSVMLLGLALTFGALWLLRGTHPTAWAIYPAIGLFIVALVAFFSGGVSNLIWATALLAAGIVLVLYSFLRKKPGNPQKPPETGQPPEDISKPD